MANKTKTAEANAHTPPKTEAVESVVIRFCGDSGDGMQMTGTQFTDNAAIFGNDISTFPDYPSEIRAPIGTVAGVSGFQINFSSTVIHTPGDLVDVLVAMNPAGLKSNVAEVEAGGIIIVNEDAFTKGNLKKAGYKSNPLEDGSLSSYRVYSLPISRLCEESLTETGASSRVIARAKNMYTLGLVYWLFNRSLDTTIDYLNNYFGIEKGKPELAELNVKALKAGYNMGNIGEMFVTRFEVEKAALPAGTYRRVSGNEATAMGLIAAGQLAKKDLLYASYPITPASDILHVLSGYKNYNVKTIQLEDEIAAMCALIGASFAGNLAVTGTSGPGLALKSEAIGLGVMMELPMVIVNVQRGGPSTGLPTKTEQADLLQAVYGRNSDCPCFVLSGRSPGDCFDTAIEAVRLAVTYMTPVILLTDGYVANGAEPWAIPDIDSLKPINITHQTEFNAHDDNAKGEGNNAFHPYHRDENLSRPWAIPGTPGLEHRIGGLEKEEESGNVCYEPKNHQRMVLTRAKKIADAAQHFPPMNIDGDDQGEVLVVGWGGTHGAIHAAVRGLRGKGRKVSAICLRHLNPLHPDLKRVMDRFDHVVIPELNMGQLRMMIRSQLLVNARGINKVQGRPFLIGELITQIESLIDDPDAFGDMQMAD